MYNCLKSFRYFNFFLRLFTIIFKLKIAATSCGKAIPILLACNFLKKFSFPFYIHKNTCTKRVKKLSWRCHRQVPTILAASMFIIKILHCFIMQFASHWALENLRWRKFFISKTLTRWVCMLAKRIVFNIMNIQKLESQNPLQPYLYMRHTRNHKLKCSHLQ